MSKRKVYISSTYRDLSSIRDKIKNLITDQNVLGNYYDVAYIMENMSIAGDSDTALNQCLKQVNDADVYILIIGSWYGSLTTHNGKEQSYTQHEYDAVPKLNKKKRIYILHSTEEFDKSVENEVKMLCEVNNFSFEDNNNRLKNFKTLSTTDLAKPICFNSERQLLDEINACFMGDIAYYYLIETISSSVINETKLRYKIDRVHEDKKLVTGMSKIVFEPIGQKSIFNVLAYSTPDDKPDYYCSRIALERCAAINTSDMKPFRSSNYTNSLSRFNSNYNLEECIKLLMTEDNFYLNSQLPNLSSTIIENKSNYFDLFYFEVSEIELTSENKWISFINCFTRNLISYYKNTTIQNRIFIFINVNYKSQDSLARHNLFEIEDLINIGCFGKLNLDDVLLFLKNEVLKISDNNSEREQDKLEQYQKLEKGIRNIQLEKEFTYSTIESYLFK